MESRAALYVARIPQPAAMRLDDGGRDGQAHAHAVGPGRVKRLEWTIHVRLVDPDPRILDREPDGRRAVPGRPDNENATTPVRLPHGLEAVERQVQHHLLELGPVAADLGQIGGEIE